MLPHRFNLNHLDNGIREVVINLNRIPDVFTYTTCEGHVWREVPAWPTKDGWVHFNIPTGKYDSLVAGTREFVRGKNGLFQLEGPSHFTTLAHDKYTMSALFEDHDCGQLFDRLDGAGQEAYYSRADARHLEHLSGWSEWNRIIEKFLDENFPNWKNMPFVDE